MPYVNKPRPYKKEYEQYDGTEKVKKKRAERNKARQIMKDAGKARKGDGKDVHHNKALSKGGTHKDGLSIVNASENRSFKRNAKRQLVNETSTREKKKSANSR
jgi:hypothetical protein